MKETITPNNWSGERKHLQELFTLSMLHGCAYPHLLESWAGHDGLGVSYLLFDPYQMTYLGTYVLVCVSDDKEHQVDGQEKTPRHQQRQKYGHVLVFGLCDRIVTLYD